MKNIICYDSGGNQITALAQWDRDVSIYLQETFIAESHKIHFFNNSEEVAYVVESTYNDGILTAKIPNILLTQPYEIIGYVFDETENGGGRSIARFRVNVRARPQPSDTIYDSTNDYISYYEILENCQTFATAEAARVTAEEARVAAEELRVASENTRDASETTRINNENSRKAEENKRVAAEAKRVTDTAKAISDAETATQNANNATEQFNQSAERIENAITQLENTNETASVDAARAEAAALRAEASEDAVEEKEIVFGAKVALKADNLFFNTEDGKLYLMSEGEIIGDGVTVATSGGGGGGGSSNNAVLTMANATGWLSNSIGENAECQIKVNWSSIEDGVPTGNGVLTVKVGGATKLTSNVTQGEVTINVTPFLLVGTNTVKVTISDAYGNSRTINFTVSVVALSLSSTFDASVAQTGAITYTYVPKGSVSKTMHFILDGEELGTAVVSTSGRQQSYIIPSQSHGSHKFEVYFTAEIDGQPVESNHLLYDLICVKAGNTTPIIASAFDLTTIKQYETINIPYIVYNPASMTSSVTLKANNVEVAQLTEVDRTEHTWSYRADDVGSLKLEIICGDTKKTIPMTVTVTEIDVSAETENLELHLTSYGRNNNEATPATWSYGDVECSFSNYNWKSDGWLLDDDGTTVHRVSGDARLTIPLKVFENDFRTTGKTIELEFATRDVLDYDAIILSCFSGNRGLQLTAQKALLKSGQTEIFTQYKENEHIRLTFVIEKQAENRLIYIYLNGIMSGVAQYPSDDDFSQATPVDITIGSNNCTIDIYTIRVYDNDLTRYQVLDNWIADTQDITEKLNRYSRNNVYDSYGSIIIENLPSDLPYLVLQAPILPQSKGDKKTVSGYYVDQENGDNSFEFENAEADVQGTSSAGYARKNYKIKFKNGFVMTVGETTQDGYKLRADSIPTNTFTFKADVASSEGANNVELVRLYNAICPYKTPPQEVNSKVRQGIDGFPIVIFHDDGNGAMFVGKYNFNHDKGTPEIFGFAEGDESWEIRNNTSNRVLFKSADFSTDDWKNDFEARYPEDSTYVANLQAFIAWVASTDQSTATNANLESAVTYEDVEYTKDTAEYRLAKFKAELANYADVDSTVFYYLFTEIFLMVDSRAKNAFPSKFGEDKFCWLPYDMDTAIGINNEGSLAFGYELEDTDKTETNADVYNGQQSVLWINLRQAFGDEIMEMYQNLRKDDKISYTIVEDAYEQHQAKWCEAIWNEDAYYKYLQPLIDDNTASYLGMLQGSKSEQRKWWLYNRFRYIDSKYNAGDALTDFVTLRGYSKADITVEPYADIYATIKYGSYLVQERALRGDSYTLACPLDSLNDTEIYIYSASQLKSIGDLSGLEVGYADFSMATKLTSLKLGDSSADYSNTNLEELYLGNNTLLHTLDVRNCPNLTQSVDISGCKNVENVYFDGTSTTGVSLPNGGILKVLHLPGTITNLTLLNQKALTEFVLPSYNNIETLRLENIGSIVDAQAILNTMAANGRVRLIGINWSFDDVEDALAIYDKLDTMRGLDENGNNTATAQISGKISVPTITSAQLESMKTRYPDITVEYETIYHSVTYKDWDGTVLYTEILVEGSNATDPVTSGKIDAPIRPNTDDVRYVYTGWGTLPTNITSSVELTAKYAESYALRFYNDTTIITTVFVSAGGNGVYQGTEPTRESTAQYDYAYTGWALTNGGEADANALNNITAPRNVYAAYSATIRKYTVKFYNGNALMYEQQNVEYGTNATYGSETVPTKAMDAQFIYTFDGWSRSNNNVTDDTALLNIQGDTNVYATFTTVTRVYTVRFYNGDTFLQAVENVPYGDTVEYTGESPTKAADAQYIYTFSGWSKTNGGVANNNDMVVVGETNLFAAYTTTIQTYTVTFMNGNDILQTVTNVPYGGTAKFTGTTPTPDTEGFVFAGWYPSNTNIKGDTICQPVFADPNALNAKSWAEISELSNAGTAANYFAVGDAKAVTLDGTVGTLALDNVTLYVYILGFNHNADYEGNGITFGCFKTAQTGGKDVALCDSKYGSNSTDGTKYFNMNHWGNSNRGGWAGCDMRYDILGSTDVAPSGYGSSKSSSTVGYDATETCATNPVANTLMAALPSDLRAVMKPMTKYSDNKGGGSGHVADNVTATIDYLPLLGEMEIFGTGSGYNNNCEDTYQKQYDYYAAGNSKVKYKYDSNGVGSAVYWWERSAHYTNYYNFCFVYTNGNANCYGAINAYGLAPAFKV